MRTLLLYSCASPFATIAQVPSLSIDFIPFPAEEKPSKSSGFEPVFLTEGHAIFQLRHFYKDDRTLYTIARSGGEAMAHPFSLEPEGGGRRQKWLSVKGKVYTVIADHDFKTGLIRFLVEPRSADGGESLGAPWEVGRLEVEKKTYLDVEKIGLRIVLSPNEERCVLYFDRLRSTEKEQLVMCWVLGSDMQPSWQNG
jgi:hypothetical protein